MQSSLHELFLAQAARTPDAEALVARGERLTYAELAERAGRLADWLRNLGVRPERRVAVCLERSADLVAALLGILQAGGAYVPLDPAYPGERLAYLLEDCGAEVVLTSSNLLPLLPATRVRTALLDLPPRPSLPSPEAPPPTADNLAYVLYTSGSTGLPKGVAVTHRSAVAFIDWASGTFSDEELAGVLAATSISFDLSVFEIFLPLARGGTVILAENALAFATLPEAGEVTLVNTVPSLLGELLRVGALPPSVKTVNLAGEPLRRSLVDRIEAAGTVERIYNLYGPTESTTYATWTLVPQRIRDEPTLGRPITGTRVALLEGEIFLGGAGLARGYLDRPDLTAERFLPDPSSLEPGERLYRTGDLGRLLPSGEIEYLGRADHQIKVQGLRIEPGEIENAILEFPGIREALVIQREDAGARRLVAYVVGNGGEVPLRAFLRRRLPGPLVPSAFVFLDAFPLTPNGKIDRKALPIPGVAAGSSAPPRTPLEELLTRAWSEELGVESAGIDDDFFALGGHSLIAFRVLARLRAATGVDLHLRVLFEAPTPAALAERVERELAGNAARPELPPLVPVDRMGDLPLSFAQEGLWFLDRLAPGISAYNLATALRITGPLDAAAFRHAIAALIERHEVLRTNYPATVAGPRADRCPHVEPLLADLSALPTTRQEPEACHLAAAEAHRPFDLEKGPLFRTLLVRFAERDWLAVLNLHHIAADGWSREVLREELAALYGAFVRGEMPSLPALPVQFIDFVVWQRRALRPEIVATQATWWKETLSGAPPVLDLPTDRPRPALPTFRGFRLEGRLGAVPAEALRGLARREGATLFMVLLAGLEALLYRITGEEDLTVGTPVAGRGRPELERVVGLFVNTLVLRGQVEGGTRVRRLIAAARETALGAFAHQELPFEKLVDELKVERTLRHNPLFQVMLAFQGTASQPPVLPGVEVRFEDLPMAAVPFDLGFEIAETPEDAAELAVALEAAADLFDPATAQRLLDRFLRLLAAAAEEPERRIADLPLLAAPERHQLLVEWNDTAPAEADALSAPQLFAKQARRTPAAVALVHGERSWTFAELQGRALRIARRLRRLGAGPETRVGISVERSPELVAAILGVWYAGAAYVPLDPGQPAARLAAIAEDAFAGQAEPLLVTKEMLGPWEEEEDGRDPALLPRAGDLAYLLYTSGTTGRPKGVMVEHGSLAHTLRAFRLAFGFEPGDRMPCLAPFSFDIFLFELLAPLLAGGTSVLVDLEPAPDVPALVDGLAATTLLHAVPAVMRQIVDEVRRQRGAAPGLRRVLTGGDAVPPSLLADLREVFPAAQVTVLYGPTEATLVAASFMVDGPLPAGNLIGRPLPGVSLSLRDRDGHPMPIGVPGEIWLGGPGVARGYWRRPEQTADVFIPSLQGRFYRTGDLARQLADGTVEFLGRIDQQVKIRGVRIEPGEVEAALTAHPAVREAAVQVRLDSRGERILAAWVALADGSITAADLAGFLRRRLPEPMIPTSWAFLPALPLTAHGKVDRRALPDPEKPSVAPTAAPRSQAEELLAGIWAELLGRQTVGVHDDFFAGGGHSLLAVQAVSRVRAAFGVELPVGAIFEAPTPAGLAARIEGLQIDQAPPLPSILPVGRRSLPLSFAQERLWFLDQVVPGNVYNIPLVLRLRGPFDPGAWARSLDEVRRRHEALRTTFRNALGGPVQVVEPFALRILPRIDLSALPAAAREPEAMRLAADEAARPFDLRTGPLLRASLVRLDADDEDDEDDQDNHRALLVCHHIIADGWSTAVLLGEMEALYAAFSAGLPSPLPPLPIQYPDYAVWQRRWMDAEALAAPLAWWRRTLAGDPPLDLPTDRPRPLVRSYAGAVVPVDLPGDLVRSLRALARETGSTLFMVLLAAFATLLHRLSGNEEVRIGTPVANRLRPEVERLIGFFVNTLVLPVDLAGEPRFTDLLARVRAVALGAWAHQDVPFEKIVEALRPERRLDQNPLFQVAFGLDRKAHSQIPIHSGTAKFDLYAGMEEDADGGLSGFWELAADLFDPSTVRRFGSHWRSLLADLAADPGRQIGELALLSPAERHQLACEWNDTAADYPRDATLWELFLRQAERAPGDVAVSQGDAVLTYGELARRAQGLGARLRSLGVGPDVPVALALARSFDLVVTLLGILEAGGAYVPLDLSHPPERLAFLLRDTGAPVVVTRDGASAPQKSPHPPGPPLPPPPPPPPGEGETPGRAVGWWRPSPGEGGRGGGRGDGGEGFFSGVRTLDLSDLSDLSDFSDLDGNTPVPRAIFSPRPHPDNLAYILYTSGSTGTPKGVAVTQRNVARLVLGTDYARFGPEEVFFQAAPLAFDASTLEIWGPLLHGGRLVLPSVERPSLAELAREIRGQGVTTLWLTAGLFHHMVDEEIEGLGGVRQLLAGGDVVSPAAVRQVLARHPGLVVIDGYGPTEGTTFSCCHPMRNPADVGPVVPIGRPIANTAALVLDHSLRPVPVGVPGELVLGGEGLARGYFGRPDLTAERFVPHPFSLDGERLYRTGDRVRRRPDGTLEFLGRIDLQVKVAGWRIEPAEIEATLAVHPAVRQNAVVAMDEPPAGKRLVAYVAPQPASGASLRDWLRRRLPEPMVPSVWVFLDRLPLTPNGKVDRAALPPPDPERSSLSVRAARPDGPRTPVEELLAGLWADLLGVERVGLHDNFFDLGGHSLLATRLIARVRQVLGVDLPLRDLFEEPTVDGLAARIALLQAEGAGVVLSPLLPAPPASTYPASLGQRRLWFLQRLSPDDFFFNVSHGLRLRGRLVPEALRRSLQEIVARHEPLRTTFETRTGLPVQRIGPPAAVPLPILDVSALPSEQREETARWIALAEAEQPFDLPRGPLFRAVLVRLDADDHVLLLTPHHLVFDGWSMEILFRELTALYDTFSRGLPPELAPLPFRFADFSEWQRQILAGPLRARQLAWWKERLAGLAPLDLPTDRPRPAVQRFRGDWRTTVLPASQAAALEKLGRQAGATPFMILLAGFAILLARWSGKTDLPIGSPRADRVRPEVEGLIGFFVNTLVLRTDLDGEPRFSEVVARVRETALGAWAHQDLPFEVLVEELVPERDLSANPLFQVAFSLQEAPGVIAVPELGIDLEPFDYETDVALFDLTLIAARSTAGLTLTANFRRDLFDGVTALRLLEQLTILLAGAAADPEARAWELPLWSASAWHQMTREWNDTATVDPGAVTLIDLFERRAAGAPEALAVAGEEGRLTYGELDQEANRLARHLLRLGVAHGARVALVLEPSPELVTAALAVWKAGGVYIPLDPGAPPERLAGMMADAGAVAVLSRERLAARLEECGLPILRLDLLGEDRALWAAESGEAPARETGPGDLACIIYTSGSTGVPKGAVLVHRGLLNLALWHQRTFALTPADRTAMVVNPSFDVCAWEMWPVLSGGASLHALPRELVASTAETARWMAARGVTLTFLPTPLSEDFLRRERPKDLALRALYIGGDRLRYTPPSDPGLRFVNAYGPAETSVVSTHADVIPDPAPARPPSIGRPMSDAQVHLLDPQLRPVPLGAVGEICVGGRGIAAGYRNRADLTADRFIANPFSYISETPGARLYRTGDLARHRADGTLDFVGRADFQVKIRGVRIELGEVEAQLNRHPDLVAAVAAARDDSAAGRRLVAWVVPRPDSSPTPNELRDFLRAKLPEVMVPTAWVLLDTLPLTPRGKVDRRALPAPPPATTSREAPQGQAERVVARLWSEVLGVAAVGRDDNFFDLGGHSLALAAVHERLQAELGLRLPLVALFESTTVRTLAARVAVPVPEMPEMPEGTESVAVNPAPPPGVAERADRQRGAAAWKERTRLARGLARPSSEEG